MLLLIAADALGVRDWLLLVLTLLLIVLLFHVARARRAERHKTRRLEEELAARIRTENALRESESRFTTALKGSPVIVWCQDAQLRYTWAYNPTGRSVEELIGKTDGELMRPEDAKVIESVKRGVLDSGRGVRTIVRAEIGGRLRDFDLTVEPLRDASGIVTGITCACMDITDRRQAEVELRKHEQLLRQTGRIAHIGGWEVDLKTMTPVWSEEVYRIHEVDPSVKPDLNRAIDFYAPEARPVIAAAVRDAIEQGKPYDLELPFITAKGRHIWVRSMGEPTMENGVCVRLAGTFQDITHIKLSEEALRRSEEHHRQAAESNRRLLNEVNHRVRNNLANLMSLISILRKRNPDPAQLAGAIQHAVRAMAEAHNLLARNQWEGLNLRELLDSILSSCRAAAPHVIPCTLEGPTVSVTSRQALPVSLMVLELLTNSGKYGAHSVPHGNLSLTWSVAEQDGHTQLHLRWRESGGPRITAPVKRSVGTELIEGFVNFELGGRCEMTYPAEGVDHLFVFPIEPHTEPATPR